MGLYKSQNREAEIVIKYFDGYVGTVLDIGANDGITFSNSYDLIQLGWRGELFEPGEKAFNKLKELYPVTTVQDKSAPVTLHFCGISHENGSKAFYESGAHVKDGKDVGLVSTIVRKELNRWKNVLFNKTEAFFWTWSFMMENGHMGSNMFDFITIDAEGSDMIILHQMDLTELNCRCICLEWNGDPEKERFYTKYCGKHGLKEIHRNAENIIYAY